MVQLPAHGHVQQLEAPADAQHGLVCSQDHFQKFDLHLVPLGKTLAAMRPLGLPIQLRGHVLAAGKEEAIHRLDQLLQAGLFHRHGQHHRQPPGLLNAVEIAGVHPKAVSFRVHQGQHTDQRFFHTQKPPKCKIKLFSCILSQNGVDSNRGQPSSLSSVCNLFTVPKPPSPARLFSSRPHRPRPAPPRRRSSWPGRPARGPKTSGTEGRST